MRKRIFSILMILLVSLSVFAACNEGIETYTVTFDGTGGTVSVESLTVKGGEKITEEVTAERSGYSFNGWYTAENEKWDFENDVVVSDMTLYASWTLLERDSFTVTYNLNGGQGSIYNETVSDGDTAKRPVDPVKDHYIFKGWFTDDGTQWNFETDKVESNITLTAEWEIEKFNLTVDWAFDDLKDVEKKDYGTEITAPSKDRKGYTLKGFVYADESAVEFPFELSGDIVITAVWEAKSYTVKVDGDGGLMSKDGILVWEYDSTVKFDETTSFLVPEKPGCAFNGYVYNGELITDEHGTLTKSWDIDAENIVIVAQYTESADYGTEYTLTFSGNGAEVTEETHTVKYGEAFELPVVQKENYNFVGWYIKAIPYGLDEEEAEFANEEYIRITDKDGKSALLWGWKDNETAYAVFSREPVDNESVKPIFSSGDLSAIRSEIDKTEGITYLLQRDISLSAYENWSTIGTQNSHAFKGTFDGNGYKIGDLKFTGDQDKVKIFGLFGYVIGGALRNVILENINIDMSFTQGDSGSTIYLGALAAFCGNGVTVENCVATGKINVVNNSPRGYYMYVTPLIGVITTQREYTGERNRISGCYTDVEVSAVSRASSDTVEATGMVCEALYADITNCYSLGNVLAKSETSEAYAAGLATYVVGSISNCWSKANIIATGIYNVYVGGVAATVSTERAGSETVNSEARNIFYAGKIYVSRQTMYETEAALTVNTWGTVKTENLYYLQTSKILTEFNARVGDKQYELTDTPLDAGYTQSATIEQLSDKNFLDMGDKYVYNTGKFPVFEGCEVREETKKITITFVTEGEPIDDIVITKGDIVVYPETEPTRESEGSHDYYFQAYYRDSDYNNIFTFEEFITEDLTLYVKFGVNTRYVTVSFNTDGGGVIEAQRIEWGTKVSRPETIPQKGGYTFIGWYNGEDADTAFDFDTEITEDITLTARYSQNQEGAMHTVTFDAKGGHSTYEQLPVYENVAFNLGVATKDGWFFVGWYMLNEDGTYTKVTGKSGAGEEWTIQSDVSVIAVWSIVDVDETADLKPVYTLDEFKAIRLHPNNSYILQDNINLLNEEWIPLGTSGAEYDPEDSRSMSYSGWTIMGDIYGNGFTVSNMTITQLHSKRTNDTGDTYEQSQYLSLFGSVGADYVIRDLNVENVTITYNKPALDTLKTNMYAAAVADTEGKLINVHVKNVKITITSEQGGTAYNAIYIGALASSLDQGATNCGVDGATITVNAVGAVNVAGICPDRLESGEDEDNMLEFRNLYVKGLNIDIDAQANVYASLMFNQLQKGIYVIFADCYAQGTIDVNSSSGNVFIAGFIDFVQTKKEQEVTPVTFENCVADAALSVTAASGTVKAGGFVAENSKATKDSSSKKYKNAYYKNCVASGSITYTENEGVTFNAGAFVGIHTYPNDILETDFDNVHFVSTYTVNTAPATDVSATSATLEEINKIFASLENWTVKEGTLPVLKAIAADTVVE